MIFSKALALKVLGGLAVCTGVTVGGVKLWEKSKTENQEKSPSVGTQEGGQNPNPGIAGNLENPNSGSDPNSQASQTNTQQAEETVEELIKKAGLSCGDVNSVASTGNECSILTEPTETKLNVKQGDTTFEVSSIPDNSGKIKLYKLSGYNKNLKFVIEDGDITATPNKLEQFETYEITEETVDNNKKYFLTRKSLGLEEKSKALGLPNNCVIPEDENEKTCSPTTEETKALNFEGKKGTPTVAGNTTLTIVKSSEDGFAENGYKFIIDTTDSITVTKSDNSSYILKAGTKTEFKIKKEGGKWTLEKAWDASNLGEKIGLENCVKATGENSNNECTFKTDAKINLFNSDDDKVVGASITPQSSGGQTKMKYYENEKKYNQGIKFQAYSNVTLTGGTPDSGDKKIESFGSNTSYQIMKKEGNWYLVKVPAETPP